MMIKAVLFDVDGTLVDTVDLHARAWEDTFREFGQDIPFERIRPQIGKGGDQLMPALLPPEVLEAKGKDIERRRGEIMRERYLPQAEPLPGARELVARVSKAGFHVALASSAKPEELAALKRVIGLNDGLTDAETSSADAERSKPHPDIFQAALDQLPGVSAAEAIAIGDAPYDAEASGKLGIPTIGLLSGGFPEEVLRRAGCIAIFRDPAHLLAEYDTSPLGASGMPD